MPPSNNSCAAATTISSLDYSLSLDPTGTGQDFSNSDYPCSSGTSYGALWWKWTATMGVSKIGVKSISNLPANSVVTVWSGSCGALTHLGCTNFDAHGIELLINVSSGTDYFFMVTSEGATLPTNETLFVRNASALTNDTCSTATTVSSLPYSNTEDTTNATQDGPAFSDGPCGTGQSYFGVWYKYTVAVGVTRLATKVSDSLKLSVVTAFSGSCGSPVSMGCEVSGTELFIDVTPGNTYYFLNSGTNQYHPPTTTFTLRDASAPSGSNTLCADFECGPTLITGPQRRWSLHRFDLKPSPSERS